METFQRESFYYLIVAGGVQAVGALLIAPFYFLVAQRVLSSSFSQQVRAYFVFNAFLLIWGCLGNYVFHSLTFDKLYVSADRVVDWFPFVPFGQWVLDQNLGEMRGELLGRATLGQLRLIWLAVAAPVWMLTFASTISVLRLRDFRRRSSAG